MTKTRQAEKIRAGNGFVAALDQSGGSTPKALALYGVDEDAYTSEVEMFDLIHAMRVRIAQAPDFNGDKVIGAILFEMTMDRLIDGKPSAAYLWQERGVVPFLKVDKGLEDLVDGVRLMKPMPEMDALCIRAVDAGIFGTKMRSVIDAASRSGIEAIVAQQFEIGRQILAHGLIPIIEPEVTITIDDKAEAETLLLEALKRHLDTLPAETEVMLKLTLPEEAGRYEALTRHPAVLGVVALSGGYSRDEANRRLAQNAGIVASFSRALTEGLSAGQSDAEFNKTIGATINSIHAASVAG